MLEILDKRTIARLRRDPELLANTAGKDKTQAVISAIQEAFKKTEHKPKPGWLEKLERGGRNLRDESSPEY